MRKPNTKCYVCSKPLYRRPSQIAKQKNVYCSQACFNDAYGFKKFRTCAYCGKKFYSKDKPKTAKNCSVSCSNKGRRGIHYGKGNQPNASRRRLTLLESTFAFTSCMVAGCDYFRTYDIHRLVPGSMGGEYKIGNMFAICPMHHAEEHRGICKLTKVDDKTLEANYGL